MPMKDFRCQNHEEPIVFEKLVQMDVEEYPCPECGQMAERIYTIEQRGPVDLVNRKSLRFHFNYME